MRGGKAQEVPEQVSWEAAAAPCVPCSGTGRTGQGGASAGPAAPRTWHLWGLLTNTPRAESQLKHTGSTCEPHVSWSCQQPVVKPELKSISAQKEKIHSDCPAPGCSCCWWTLGTLFPLYPNSSGVTNKSLPRHTPTPPACSQPPLFRNNPFNQDLQFLKAN